MTTVCNVQFFPALRSKFWRKLLDWPQLNKRPCTLILYLEVNFAESVIQLMILYLKIRIMKHSTIFYVYRASNSRKFDCVHILEYNMSLVTISYKSLWNMNVHEYLFKTSCWELRLNNKLPNWIFESWPRQPTKELQLFPHFL